MNDILNLETSIEIILNNLESHYKTVSDYFGYKVNPPERLISQLGHGFMKSDKLEKAVAFFKMNV